MRFVFLDRWIFCAALTATLLLSGNAFAQSTITNRPLDLTFGTGVWGALLPSYDLGTTVDGSSAIHDDMDTAGVINELKLVRRFLHTRTSIESNVFYASANSNKDGELGSLSLPNPETGAATTISGFGSRLDSQIDHYGVDVALRDTWQTRFGGLSAGLGFSSMWFDQDFDVRQNGATLISERLNSDFVGGKGFVGWEGWLWGRATSVDLTYGLYDLNVDYDFHGGTIPGSHHELLQKTASTGKISVTRYGTLRGVSVGFTFAALYITDMPSIEHRAGSVAKLDTTDAATLSGMFHFLF